MVPNARRELAMVLAAALVLWLGPVSSGADSLDYCIYDPGKLKPVDSGGKLKVGDPAPDISLPDLSGERVTLSQFRGKKNVVISFVPAASTALR
jgi:hypothetical protein